MDSPADRPLLRIGELSRRLGVSDHVLRAWESRYGLLQPVRSAGGFRLYSQADQARIRRMQAYLAEGLSAIVNPMHLDTACGQTTSPARATALVDLVVAGSAPRP